MNVFREFIGLFVDDEDVVGGSGGRLGCAEDLFDCCSCLAVAEVDCADVDFGFDLDVDVDVDGTVLFVALLLAEEVDFGCFCLDFLELVTAAEVVVVVELEMVEAEDAPSIVPLLDRDFL